MAKELVNCYSKHDWVLALNLRLYTLSHRVGGLRAVEVEGVRDVDCSDLIHGHLEIREKVGAILERVKSGEEGPREDRETKELEEKVEQVKLE